METSLQSVAQAETEPATGPDRRFTHRVLWGVVDRKERAYWTRIGVAFENNDGSWFLRFDYMPTSSEIRIHMREPKEREDREPSAPVQSFP